MKNKKQILSSPRVSTFTCKCGSITTLESLSLKPTSTIRCVDCGSPVEADNANDLTSIIDNLVIDYEIIQTGKKLINERMISFKQATKAYRDLEQSAHKQLVDLAVNTLKRINMLKELREK